MGACRCAPKKDKSKMNLRLLLAMVFLLYCGCGFAVEMSVWKSDEHTLVAYGQITNHSLDVFKSANIDGVTKLIITSQGGDIGAATKIGAIVFDRGIRVIVSGYCFSACASWIFIPAKEKSLPKGGAIGLHGGEAEFRMVRDLVEYTGEDPLKNPFLMAAEEANELYVRAGVDTKIHQKSWAETSSGGVRSTCKVKNIDGSVEEFEIVGNKVMDMDAIKRHVKRKPILCSLHGRLKDVLWFPSKEDLVSYGVSGMIDYHYPETSEDAQKIGQEYGVKLIGSWPH